MELFDIINDKKNLTDIKTDNSGSWQNDGIGPYEYWGAKGFDKGHTYFEYTGDFSFNFPVSLLPEDFDDIDVLTDNLEETDLPNFVLDECTPYGVNETPDFIMKAEIKDDIVYIEGVYEDTEFSTDREY